MSDGLPRDDAAPLAGGPSSTVVLGHGRHPTISECYEAGKGPQWVPNMANPEGGLPNTLEERERFEAYMRGHCWDFGRFDPATNSYDTTMVRMLYGVWRDRGALPTTWPNPTVERRL